MDPRGLSEKKKWLRKKFIIIMLGVLFKTLFSLQDSSFCDFCESESLYRIL